MTLLILGLAGALATYVNRLQGEILKRRSAQSKAQERSTQLDAIFALSPDGFISFDPEHCVRFVNPAFFRLLAQAPMQLEGLHEQEFSAWLADRCMPSLRFAGLSHMRAMPTPRAVIAIALPPDGATSGTDARPSPRFLQVDYSQSTSGPVSQILYFRDVTHEFEVGRMKSEFLSTAAHELRTPMASIFGFTEMLLEGGFEPDSQREFLEIIYQQSKDVARILDELLDLARIESRKGMDFQRVSLDLAALLQECVKAHKPPADRDRPELVLSEQAAWVLADAGKLRQVVGNVLSNAYKYSPQGGAVEVRLDTSPLPAAQCHIRITDHGIGLTPDQIKHVWDRFYRADTSGSIPGTGLGMTIVKEIIELHGGCVGIESTPGKGSTVTMTLPLCT
jgi:signal transduction histidine kinase